MKKALLTGFSFFVLTGWMYAVTAPTLTITNLYGTGGSASSVEYFRGSTLILTQCVAYAGATTSAARQNLTGASVVLRIGAVEYSKVATGQVDTATSGVWSCSFTVPTNSLVSYNIQLTVADTNATVIYPWQSITTKEPLE